MELTPLDPRARLLFYLQAFSRLALFWLPVSMVGGAILMATWWVVGGLLAAAGVLFLAFLSALWWPSLAFDRWGYAVGDQELLIGSGVLLRRVTAIPLARVQHVDTRQGLIEQWLGLAHVAVYTASGLGADGLIPGLSLEDAEGLRDRLVKRAFGEDDGV